MPNLYVTRELAKRALNLFGPDQDGTIDRLCEAVSRDIDQGTRRNFIPITATKSFRWPSYQPTSSWTLWLASDLLSVATLTIAGTVTTSYFLEPNDLGPPYSRIEIDLSSSASFSSGNTPQRSIAVAGDWGCCQDTAAAGALAAAMSDTTGTTLTVTNGALIDVGHTLLIGSERLFVTERATVSAATTLNGDIAATPLGTTLSNVTMSITLADATKVNAGEVVQLDSERFYVRSITGNVCTVLRGYDNTVAAAHTGAVTVYVFRVLTVTRGANGSTAATHSNAAAISKYTPPGDVVELAVSDVVVRYTQEKRGFARTPGPNVGGTTDGDQGAAITAQRTRVLGNWQRLREAAV